MFLEINDTTRIRDIENVFSNRYPYLKIEFYRKAHNKNELSDDRDIISSDKRISDFKKTHVSGILEIQPHFSVMAVEKEFLHRFGLSVQVVWKKNDQWVQAAGMGDYTLKGLNEVARGFSDEYILEDLDEGPEELPTPSDLS